MKLQQSVKKSVATIFVFIIGVFVVSGLSYVTSTFAVPSNPPTNNAFTPISEGSNTQGRCSAKDQSKPIRTVTTNYNSSFYTDCEDSSPLFLNGILVKTPNTSFVIHGDKSLSSSYQAGALYVGCSSDTKFGGSIIDGCYNSNHSTPATFHGAINMFLLSDQNATGDRELCVRPSGKVEVCQ